MTSETFFFLLDIHSHPSTLVSFVFLFLHSSELSHCSVCCWFLFFFFFAHYLGRFLGHVLDGVHFYFFFFFGTREFFYKKTIHTSF